jgi:hypothetical protein
VASLNADNETIIEDYGRTLNMQNKKGHEYAITSAFYSSDVDLHPSFCIRIFFSHYSP